VDGDRPTDAYTVCNFFSPYILLAALINSVGDLDQGFGKIGSRKKLDHTANHMAVDNLITPDVEYF
jgi:hypothetical protein